MSNNPPAGDGSEEDPRHEGSTMDSACDVSLNGENKEKRYVETDTNQYEEAPNIEMSDCDSTETQEDKGNDNEKLDAYDDDDVDDDFDSDEDVAGDIFSRFRLSENVEFNTLDDIASRILEGKCKNVLVLSGAGVSVAAGIPDFRSPGTGLYDNLQKYNLPFPEAVFDIDFYRGNPQPFISLVKELWPGASGYLPTLSHYFVKLLDEKGLLLRNYTQNIDGLEVLAGVPPEKMVECHGHFREAACIECKRPYDGELCKAKIVGEGIAPICEYDYCEGLIKPTIVFFGESLPPRFSNLIRDDIISADLLIVMGTSLKVAPVSLIPQLVDNSCPRVLFNREIVGTFAFDNRQTDVCEKGDCDTSVRNLCEKLGWTEDLNRIRGNGGK